ncbi:MAG: 30S ribosomal protein S16 [Candidatus Levybacteria bacterium]|nr:30S ribosomal protein S16 [Candidatus Levybacteria bacterium]
MLVIRLAKVGKKGEAKFRIVVKEKRRRRDGKPTEFLGWYIKNEKGFAKHLNTDRIAYWLSKGAKPTPTVAKIISSK